MKPTADELDDIILSARYGELDEIEQFVAKYGINSVADAVDERGNGCLHMAAANGHIGTCVLALGCERRRCGRQGRTEIFGISSSCSTSTSCRTSML